MKSTEEELERKGTIHESKHQVGWWEVWGRRTRRSFFTGFFLTSR
jgi:hypothetical protein